MKRFTFMLLAAFVAVVALAAGPKKQFAPQLFTPAKTQVQLGKQFSAKQAPARLAKQTKATAKAHAPKKAATAADLAGSYLWEYAMADDTAEDPTTVEGTDYSANVTITAGDDETVTISGMFTNDLTGTINTEYGAIVVEGGQIAGTSSYGDYAIYGLFYFEGDEDYEAGWYYNDIYIDINEDGSLTVEDWLVRVLSGGTYDGYSLTPYWMPGSTLTPSEAPEAPEVVVAPEGLEFAEYALSYTDYNGSAASGTAAVGIDGDDVYFKGFSSYIPDALIKGTKDGNTITFAANQYLGSYSGYDSYFIKEAVFTYDAEADTYTATGNVYSLLGGRYIDVYATDPVLKGVVEQAATPADPAITALKNGDYGWYITFNVPNVDVDGNGMVSSKLSYIIYTDTEGEIAPLTFTPETHTYLTEEMTEIPYGFTEAYDFYDGTIYLNDLYSADWNNLGIQSIYRGGDEENATEIQWYHIKDYAAPEGVSFEWIAAKQGYENDQEVMEFVIAKDEEGNAIVTGLADKADGDNAPKYYTSGEALRLYANNTLTITSEEPMAKIVFTMTGSAKQMSLEADKGEYTFDSQVGVGTWTGEETEVVFSVPSLTGYQARIQKIKVFFEGEGGDEPVVEEDVLVTLPKGVEPVEYTLVLSGATNQGAISDQDTKLVAFDGDDVYLQGLAYYFPEAYVKGTRNADGQYVVKSGQFVGEDGYGKEYIVGVSVDDESNFVYENEIVFDFDEETEVISLVDGTYYGESESKSEPSLWDYFESAVYTPGAFVLPDVVELPEGAEVETWYLSASDSEDAAVNREVGVAFVEGDIYVQGLCDYLPEAWVKGTIDSQTATATFPSGQFYGTYNEKYNLFFVGFDSEDYSVKDVVFSYDAENGVLTTADYVTLGSDANGTNMYDYYYDVLISRDRPDTFPVEAPEGLETETYLFAAKQFVNPEEDGARKAVASAETTFNFNAMDVAVSSGSGATYNNAGDITEALPLTEGDVTLTVSPKDESATTQNRFWGTNNGPQLRVYSGTLTFEVPEGKTMSQIVFNNGKWNDGNVADAGEFDGATWTGDAQKVVVTIAGNTQLNNIVVTVESENGEEPGDEPGDEPVEDTDWVAYSNQVQVGFDGDDAYIQGIVADCPKLWVKATKNEAGQYVIPANQYMGTYDVGGYGWFIYDYYFTAVDEEGNLVDAVLNYDAETQTFTTDQTLATNGDRKVLYYYEMFKDVTITKMLEVAATPADPSVVGFNGTSSYPSVQFDIPAEDVDGNALMASKLFYTIWIEKDGVEQQLTLSASDYEALEEDMTEIPYTFGDDWDIYAGGSRVYLNMASDEILSWTKIGIQSIYRGAGEENKSNIVWVDVENGAITTGINIAKTDDLRNAVIYNLAGQRLQTLQKGLNIINGRKVVIK